MIKFISQKKSIQITKISKNLVNALTIKSKTRQLN